MRILFVSQTYLKKDLGASKVIIELAEEMTRLGWKCDLRAAPDLIVGDPGRDVLRKSVKALGSFLQAHARDYDVVDYEHTFLPFPRSTFDERPLLVARSVLLHRETKVNAIPRDATWKGRMHAVLFGRREEREHREVLKSVRASVDAADLVNVANHADEADLVAWGIPKSKIVVLPYGLSTERRRLFDAINSLERPAKPTVAFVGTFDNRKGATDFPALVQHVTSSLPESSFLLLGTYKSESDVLSKFPIALRPRVKVIPQYTPESLPELLMGCSVGVFPSYLESFGFGILEMLAAGLPVIAYDVPGPPMMLPPEYLVPRGDIGKMGEKVIGLIGDSKRLADARSWARERSRAFSWKDIAQKTSEIYLGLCQERAARKRSTGTLN
jgi:glycosyltransferase involved in cell wall biosynthesis